MANNYAKYERKGNELIEMLHNDKLLKQICVEGHGGERHRRFSQL